MRTGADLERYPAYVRAVERGRLGEDFLLEKLSPRLEGTGLTARLTREDDHRCPFDIEVVDEHGKVVTVIENKDLRASATYRCTRIEKSAKDRKTAYVHESGDPQVFTTITERDTGQVSFREGLVNGVPGIFNHDLDSMVGMILKARGSA
jgi:hypothetical protein